MKTQQNSFNKKQLELIKKEIHTALDELYLRIEALLDKKLQLNVWLEKLDKRLEKIEIKNDLIHETYLDLVLLVNLQQKKIKELEKRLEKHPELNQS